MIFVFSQKHLSIKPEIYKVLSNFISKTSIYHLRMFNYQYSVIIELFQKRERELTKTVFYIFVSYITCFLPFALLSGNSNL